MASRSSLIIGNGEIGKALKIVLEKKSKVDIRDIESTDIYAPKILHICYPYSDSFVETTRGYMERYNPDLVIIYSTVAIGTCDQLGAVHSPIEGRHPDLAESIMVVPRWLGSSDEKALKMAREFWRPLVKIIRVVPKADMTEFLKLRSTARFGINLVFADYENKVAKELEMPWKNLVQFDSDYNDMYDYLGYIENKRYLLFPPDGEIGGHCVVPNAKLLDKQFPDKWLKEIIRMGKK